MKDSSLPTWDQDALAGWIDMNAARLPVNMMNPEGLAKALTQAAIDSGAKITPENKKKAREWLDYARDDLEICKVVYSRGLYRGSVLFLQQSSEKVCKSFLICLGVCSEEEVKDYSHRIANMVCGVLGKADGLLQFIDPLDPGPNGVGIAVVLEVERKIDDPAIASHDLIIEQVKTCEEYARGLPRNVASELKKAKRSGAKMADVTTAQKLVTSLGSIMPVFYIAHFASPHAVCTRYPRGRVAMGQYGPGLGIIDATPELVRILDGAIELLDGAYR